MSVKILRSKNKEIIYQPDYIKDRIYTLDENTIEDLYGSMRYMDKHTAFIISLMKVGDKIKLINKSTLKRHL